MIRLFFSWVSLMSKTEIWGVKCAKSHHIAKKTISKMWFYLSTSIQLAWNSKLYTCVLSLILSHFLPEASNIICINAFVHCMSPLFNGTTYIVLTLPFPLNQITFRWLHNQYSALFFSPKIVWYPIVCLFHNLTTLLMMDILVVSKLSSLQTILYFWVLGIM